MVARAVERGRGEDDAIDGVRLTCGVQRAAAAGEAKGRAGEQRAADVRGQVAATAGGADRRADVSGILGRLARPRARARGPAERRGEGWAGRLA